MNTGKQQANHVARTKTNEVVGMCKPKPNYHSTSRKLSLGFCWKILIIAYMNEPFLLILSPPNAVTIAITPKSKGESGYVHVCFLNRSAKTLSSYGSKLEQSHIHCRRMCSSNEGMHTSAYGQQEDAEHAAGVYSI
eukprot:m.184511 g.184511  ORF g.184511 m.184511 type:complete len:136 (+) comp16669_c5_seq5:139-546(+)